MTTRKKIGLFVNNDIGLSVLSFILDCFREDLYLVVCTDKNSNVFTELIARNEELLNITLFYDEIKVEGKINKIKDLELDYIILAWWPFIIKHDIISIPKFGVINFHPSLLPFNKGKNYNFWTILEDTPFGVTLHFVDESIDGGDIIFQSRIEKSWEDTGLSLYEKAKEEILKLFINSYPKIRLGDYTRIKQNNGEGSFHYGKELNLASMVELDKYYTARELLNILRARTFPPYPGAWFIDGEKKYEIRIEIKESIN